MAAVRHPISRPKLVAVRLRLRVVSSSNGQKHGANASFCALLSKGFRDLGQALRNISEPWLSLFSLDDTVNWEAISAIGQIVGAIGVVVSLIYVATEVRNSARATQLASRRSISEIFTLLSRQLAEHPDLRELYYRGLHDFESLEGTDLVGFAQVMLQLFRAYEEAYYGHLEGDVDPRLWRGWEAAMRDINGYPGVQAYWRSRSHWYSEEFAKYINQLQQTAKPPRLYREPLGDQ